MRALAPAGGIGADSAFARRTEGSVLIETAIVMSMLVTIIMAVTQLGMFMVERNATIRAAADVAAVAADLGVDPTPTEMTALIQVFRDVAEETDNADYRLSIKRIRWNGDGTNTVAWSQAAGGLVAADRIVVPPGGSATLPSPLNLDAGDSVVTVEAYRKHSTFSIEDRFGTAPRYVYFVQKVRQP